MNARNPVCCSGPYLRSTERLTRGVEDLELCFTKLEHIALLNANVDAGNAMLISFGPHNNTAKLFLQYHIPSNMIVVMVSIDDEI